MTVGRPGPAVEELVATGDLDPDASAISGGGLGNVVRLGRPGSPQ